MNPGTRLSSLTLSQLVKFLEPYFLPTSLGLAPNAQGTLSGRTTATTTATVQATLASLVAGSYIWRFPQPYNNPPIIAALPVGAGAVDSRLYLAEAPSRFAAIITSHDATDVRPIHLIAIGSPN